MERRKDLLKRACVYLNHCQYHHFDGHPNAEQLWKELRDFVKEIQMELYGKTKLQGEDVNQLEFSLETNEVVP